MKNRRTLVILFALVIMIGLVCALSVSADVSNDGYLITDGTTFTADEEFVFAKAPTEFPLVIETTVKFPEDFSGSGGVVFSSMPSAGRTHSMQFEIYNGHPRVRVQPTNQHTYYNFSNVNVYTGEWVNVRIVFDTENAKAHCYVDGELAQSLNITAGTVPHALKAGRPFTLANDEFTADYANRFKGAMKSLALYSDSEGENPICIYDLSNANNADIIADLSGNGHYIVRKNGFVGGTELTGTVPASGNFYKVNKVNTENFATIEMMLRGDAEDYGTLYSNYVSSPTKGMNLMRLEITSAGYLAISYWGPDACSSGKQKTTQTVTFDSLNVLDGEWRHLTIVRDDANDEYRLYVNGALAQTIEKDIPDEIASIVFAQPLYLGRDNRTGTYQHYTGEIMSLATFRDVRTVEEICRDITAGASGAADLLSCYDFKFAEGEMRIHDRSGNGMTLINEGLPASVEGEGYTPNTASKEKPVMEKLPSFTPKTIEFTVKLPSGYEYSTTDGRIFSNRPATDDARGFNGIFDVYLYNGHPSIYLMTLDGEKTSITFSDVTLTRGVWINIAITLDEESGTVSCYHNGALKQTATTTKPLDFELNKNLPLTLGWCNMSSTNYAFKGAIKSVALYSEVRSANDIAADRFVPEMDSTLIAYYDAEFFGYHEHIDDLSYNENDLINNLGDTVSYTNETKGKTFDDEEMYQAEKMLDKTPLTLEAVIKYPEEGNGKNNSLVNATRRQNADNYNVIFGNYYKYTVANTFNFEISPDNHPSVYAIDSVGFEYTFTFDKVSVNRDTWDHVAITFDAEASVASCYLNGTLRQTLPYGGELDGIKWEAADYLHKIGGDQRTVNYGYFNRLISSVTLFGDVRSAEEIFSDVSLGVNTSDSEIICHYDLSKGASGVIEDKSANGYDMVYETQWLDLEERDPDSYAYSMAVIGDTQWMTYLYPDTLANMYNWIIENKDAKKISYVLGLGDINQHDTDEQWAITSELLKTLADASIPQSIVCGGSHDSMPQYAKWIDTDYYVNAYSGIMEMGFFEDTTNGPTLSNSYSIMTIGETKYMFLTLEYGPRAAQVEWANEVIAAHPDCNVIISTHTYLYADGTHHSTWDNSSCDKDGKSSKYCGDELWDALVRRHENIVMVLSGHVAGNDVVKSEVYGDNGNKIIELLVNPQVLDDQCEGVGMVGMLYFSEDGRTVDFEYYSTARDMHYREGSQFSFEMDKISDDAAEIVNASISVGSSINVNYYAHINVNYNTVQMKFTVNGKTIIVSGEKLDGLNKYRFIYKGIAPQMMGDVIYAELIVDGVTVDTADAFSVEEYAKTLLDASAFDLTLAPLIDDAFAKTVALHDTLRALLNYGSEAQRYQNHNTDDLVSDGVDTRFDFDAEEIESVKSATEPVGDSGAKFKSATVRFDSINYLRFDFYVGNANIDDVTVTIGNTNYGKYDFIDNGDGTYSVYSNGISAVQFGKAYTATLFVSGVAVHSATYSVNSYVKSMYQSESIGELAKAIYVYGKAASAFSALNSSAN